MINKSPIKKNFYQELAQSDKTQANFISSPFRYNTPYSNLAYQDADKNDG